MATDEVSATKAASPDQRTTAAADGLKKLLDVLAPEVKPTEAAQPQAAPVVDELYGAISSDEITRFADMARTAVERYRNSMRWLVAAVAAIGLALFGSTAFAEGNPFGSPEGWIGLALASAGLVLILTAATLVFEPEDASLGELAADFARLHGKFENRWSLWRRVKLWSFPRSAATWRLKQILHGDEHEAHLGPGHKTVAELLRSIGTCQTRRVNCAKGLLRHRRWMAANESKRAIVSVDFALLLETRKGLDKAKTDYGQELNQPIAELIGLTKALRDEADREFRELATKQALLDETDHQLGMDLLHRSVVLVESGVAQLRGTFRLSRRCLLFGAILTLFGALLYIVGVKDKDRNDDATTDRHVRAGSLVVVRGSPVADEFAGKCVDTRLSVTYFDEATPKVTESFTVTVSAPEECAGTYTIPGDRNAGDVRMFLGPVVTIPKAD